MEAQTPHFQHSSRAHFPLCEKVYGNVQTLKHQDHQVRMCLEGSPMCDPKRDLSPWPVPGSGCSDLRRYTPKISQASLRIQPDSCLPLAPDTVRLRAQGQKMPTLSREPSVSNGRFGTWHLNLLRQTTVPFLLTQNGKFPNWQDGTTCVCVCVSQMSYLESFAEGLIRTEASTSPQATTGPFQ